MSEPFAHHTFTPILIDGDRRIVAAEAEWDKVRQWNCDAKLPPCLYDINRDGDCSRTCREKGHRNPIQVRVEIGGDYWPGVMGALGPDGFGRYLAAIKNRLLRDDREFLAGLNYLATWDNIESAIDCLMENGV